METRIIDGVESKIEPPLQVEENIYHMTTKERKRAKIDSLPGSLNEAIDLLDKDEIIKDALGSHIYDEFVIAKEKECDTFRTYVSPLEVDMYLNML